MFKQQCYCQRAIMLNNLRDLICFFVVEANVKIWQSKFCVVFSVSMLKKFCQHANLK